MKNSTRRFIEDLKRKEIKYSLEREGVDGNPDVVSVKYIGENMKEIRTVMFFTDVNASYKIFSVAKVPSAKREKMLEKINELHNQWRWVSIAIDEDDEIFFELDVWCSEKDIEICTQALIQIVDIADSCYPEIMKVLWS